MNEGTKVPQQCVISPAWNATSAWRTLVGVEDSDQVRTVLRYLDARMRGHTPGRRKLMVVAVLA